MEKNCSVPLPVNFNCWKHHARFINGQIESIKDIEHLDELKTYLLQIGESQMDLYYGPYSVSEISKQIIQILNRRKITSSEQYQTWLAKEEKNYQLVKLKDKSVWTLRFSEEPNRYVHIHPGRYSPGTIRVKATTLKTAILILCFKQAGEIKSIETDGVNFIRKKYLNEPPIKSFSNASRLGRMINLLSKKW
jgi:hypothetical protein